MTRTMARLRTHRVKLSAPRLRLRPMRESDWSTLLRWNQDPRVLLYWNDGDTTPWQRADLVRIYREMSRRAHMFIVEREGEPIAECWLQSMNLEEILRERPGQRLFRIDLSIGDPSLWGRGFGTEIVQALVEFGFGPRKADTLFACHVSGKNLASHAVFRKNGFSDWGPAAPSGRRSDGPERRHLILTRETWRRRGGRAAGGPADARLTTGRPGNGAARI